MGERKTSVITAYGHQKTIDKIAVSVFTGLIPEWGRDSDAETYCKMMNGLKLEGESWIYAQIVSENTPYGLDAFFPPEPVTLSAIGKLDDRALQKVLREVNSRDLALAIRGESEEVQERVFANMSKRAAEMLRQDMVYIGPVELRKVEETRNAILNIIRNLENRGEIAPIDTKGEFTL
jgi:flagellar motor switch protein FliG